MIDFGIGNPFYEGNSTTNVGTSKYIAPKVKNGDHDHRFDIYSLSVTVLSMSSDVSMENFMEGKEFNDIPNITNVTLRSILSPDPVVGENWIPNLFHT